MPEPVPSPETAAISEMAAIRQRALQVGRRIVDAKERQADRHLIRRDQIAVTRADMRQADGAPTLTEILAVFGTWDTFLDRIGLGGVELSAETRTDIQRVRQAALHRRNRDWRHTRARLAEVHPPNDSSDTREPRSQTFSTMPSATPSPTPAADAPSPAPTPPRPRSSKSERAAPRTPPPKSGPSRPQWNANSIAAAIKSWIDQHDGQIPQVADFRVANGLPGITTVERYCGNAGTAIKLAGYEMPKSPVLPNPGIGL